MNAHILVVDDEEEICDYLKDILKETGCKVKLAYCGEDVDQSIGKEPVDLAFVDLKLSTAVSGLDVIKTLKEKFPGIKVVAMTGYVDVSLKQQTDHLGVSKFMEKPLFPDDVLRAVEELLG